VSKGAIARALISKPLVLLADEPTGAIPYFQYKRVNNKNKRDDVL